VARDDQHHQFEQPLVELASDPDRIAELVGALRDRGALRSQIAKGPRTLPRRPAGDLVMDALSAPASSRIAPDRALGS